MIHCLSAFTVFAVSILAVPSVIANDELLECCDSLSNARTEPIEKETAFECSERTLFHLRIGSAHSENPPVTVEVFDGDLLAAKLMLMPTGQVECRTGGTRIRISRPDGYEGCAFSYCIMMRPGVRIRDDVEYKVTSSVTSIVTTRIVNNFDDSNAGVNFHLRSGTNEERSVISVPKGALLKMNGRHATGFQIKPAGVRGDVNCHFDVCFAIVDQATVRAAGRRTKP